MFVTRRPHGAKPHVKGTQGLAGRANPMAGRPDFESIQAENWRLHSLVSLEEDPMPESQWKSGGVADRPCGLSPSRPSPPNQLN
jgi:hypothetical protein